MPRPVSRCPNDDLLLDYAAGGLAPGWALVVACHLTVCPACRARAAAFDALGAAAVSALPADEIDEAAFDRCLARLDAPPPCETSAKAKPGAAGDLLPACLRALVGGDLGAVRWRSIGRGMRQAILPVDGAAMPRLLHLAEGVAVPAHGHGGRELTLVLAGGFHDGPEGFGPGDLQDSDETVEHAPVVDAGGPCICLTATDAPLRFQGLLPRLFQRFVRL